MKWQPGRNAQRRIPLCSDNRPVFFVSDCGRFTISRTILLLNGRDVSLWEAWFKVKPDAPAQLLNEAGVYSREDAARIADKKRGEIDAPVTT